MPAIVWKSLALPNPPNGGLINTAEEADNLCSKRCQEKAFAYKRD
jgi:hypothetical protein